MWGGEVSASQKQRCERQEWRAIGREIQPPFSLYPTKVLSFLCLGTDPRKGANELHPAPRGIPSKQTASRAQSSMTDPAAPKVTFLLSRLLKLPAYPIPNSSHISNPSLEQCPPTLWIYFIPVLVVWMKHQVVPAIPEGLEAASIQVGSLVSPAPPSQSRTHSGCKWMPLLLRIAGRPLLRPGHKMPVPCPPWMCVYKPRTHKPELL